jgi:LPS sulfotransferase NodH
MTQELKQSWRPSLKRITTGLRGNHTGYTRFIVLGRSRTGSNFLRGMLNSHPQIRLFGELFRNYDMVDWAYPGYQQTPAMMAEMQRDPIVFLNQRIYDKFPSEVSAVGFKLFYYHARKNGWEALWPHLQAEHSIRVLHIKRRNMLKTHLSRVRAAQTDVWTDVTGTQSKGGPVTLDYAACVEDFQRTQAWEQEFDAFFADHPLLEVIYEDLARNRDAEMRRVQAFLGVPYRPLEPETHRQSKESLSQAIANYAELKAQFAGTEWEAFFTD